MPTMSTSAPLIKMAIVNAQNAGLKISPICSLVSWKALLMGAAISPRIAKTIAVVTSEIQLATKSLRLLMKSSSDQTLAVGSRVILVLTTAEILNQKQAALAGTDYIEIAVSVD